MNSTACRKRRHRIALIEDDETLAIMLDYNISAAGFVVEHIACGSDAIQRLHDDPPDAVVLDWMLPGVSGIEILRQLRRHAGTRAIPVLMVTARTSNEDRKRAFACGVDGFLTKPFAVREVMHWLERLNDRPLIPGHPVLALAKSGHTQPDATPEKAG